MCRDVVNNTPLHYAALNGHLQVVSFFIEELKCPPDIIGESNMTPLQMAVMEHHQEVAQYLRERSVILYIYTAIDVIKRAQQK